MSLFGRLLINAAALWVAIRLVPGVAFTGEWWRLFFLITLGLFTFVLNALMLWFTSALSGALGLGFHVSGFGAAFIGALVVSIVSVALSIAVWQPMVREHRP